MTVKTYGVPGLTEWHGKLKVGSIEMNVSFVGGTVSPSGAQPAYMVTKDPVTQFVVEHSKEFKNGLIIVVSSQEIPGTHPRMAVPAPANTQASATVKDAGAAEGEGVAETEPGTSVSVAFNVEVADKSEAIEYLKQHYPDKNYTATKLRTQSAFDAACEECGVTFVFPA